MRRSLRISLRSIRYIIIVSCILHLASLPLLINAQEASADLSKYRNWPTEDFISLQSVAELKIMGKEFGGFIVIRNLADHTFRINYTSELGLTIFDLEITRDSLKVVHIIENLNKQSLIDKIGLIFKVFLHNYAFGEENLDRVNDKNNALHFRILKENWKYYYDPYFKLNRKQFKKGCKSVNVFYEDYQDGIPKEIMLKESGMIRLKIHLSILKYKTK